MNKPAGAPEQFDAVVVGAGFSGLYMLYRLRQLGLSVKAFDSADDVGGTWYWNRYPGARCDIPTTDYTYSFDPELEKEWTWSEKYATQPEILDYLRFVADRYGLRADIEFSTSVTSAHWDEQEKRWSIVTDRGAQLRCRYYIMASGCLSMPKSLDIKGTDRFAGKVYFTSQWPHEGVDFTGQRVAVIGTGSSGIQSIPLIARQASQLTVFQRTPNFSVPAHNGPAPADRLARLAQDREEYRDAARWSPGGMPAELTDVLGVTAGETVARERFEDAWNQGQLFAILGVFADQGVNPASNQIVADMIREKIRSVVHDPQTADALCPKDHYFGTKRPCLDTGYFETYNLPHVRLVDLHRQPITSITEDGIGVADESFGFDAIVYATGFDAMTGALAAVNATGRDGLSLAEKWAAGPSTYLGLMTAGFPNFFMLTGPGSPSVLSNMAVSIEQHVDWVADCLKDMGAEGFETIEPTPFAEAGWDQHVRDCGAITLHPTANSWYMGANVPGKPRVFLPYIGGVGVYRQACDDVVAQDYLGFRRTGPGGERCRDGVIRRMQPDVALVLQLMATMGLPPMETLSADEARAMMALAAAVRPPSPEVREVTDGMMPGPAGDLPYRVYRPASAGPHPVVLYFHGGGWVLGDLDSDDPLCRDLCVRSDAVIVSVNYRHAPEARFPAAAQDAFAALRWTADHAVELGGIPGQVAVAGWSAGGNIAAVACQLARDAGGPRVSGQLLITPVTDSDMTRPSYHENGDGYVLTTPLMHWFWDYYADPDDRGDPRAAPLRGNLDGLPPACVVTADFDPLRDDGLAYADALEATGTEVRRVRARGHTHTSVTMVGVVISGAPVRAEIAEALRDFFPRLSKLFETQFRLCWVMTCLFGAGHRIMVSRMDMQVNRSFRWLSRLQAPLVLAYAAFVFIGVSLGAGGVLLLAQMNDYGVDRATIGITFFTGSAGFVLASLSNGLLIHRLGARISLTVGGGACVLASLCLAARPPFAAFVAVQLLTGFGTGILESVLNTYIATQPNATTLLNRLHAFFGVGALIGPAFAAWMVGFAPWTVVMLVLAVAGVPLVAAFLVAYPRALPAEPGSNSVEHGTVAGDTPGSARHLVAALRDPGVLCGAAMLLVYVGLELGVGNWGFSYLVQARGLSRTLAGYSVSGFWLGLTAGRFLISPIANRAGLSTGGMMYACLAGITATATLGWLSPTAVGASAALVALGFFLGPVFPTTMAIAPQLTTPELAPTAIGVLNAGSTIGGAGLPWVAGAIAQATGIWTLMPYTVALAVVQIAVWRPLAALIRVAPADPGTGPDDPVGELSQPVL